MSTSGVSTLVARATDITFTDDALVVRLRDGRVLSVPLSWFPKLRDATNGERSHWEMLGDGIGSHWPTLDEDISVAGLLGLPD